MSVHRAYKHITSLLIVSNNIKIDSVNLFKYMDGHYIDDSLDNVKVSTYETIIGFISTVEQAEHFSIIQPGWSESTRC